MSDLSAAVAEADKTGVDPKEKGETTEKKTRNRRSTDEIQADLEGKLEALKNRGAMQKINATETIKRLRVVRSHMTQFEQTGFDKMEHVSDKFMKTAENFFNALNAEIKPYGIRPRKPGGKKRGRKAGSGKPKVTAAAE